MILGMTLGIILILFMAWFGICATNEIINYNNTYEYKDNCYCDKCKSIRQIVLKLKEKYNLEVE